MIEQSPKFPRAAPTVGRGSAEKAFFEMLDAIVMKHSEDGDFGRMAACEAISACLTFVHGRGLSGQAMKPLLDIAKAFEDVQKGMLPELFDPQAESRSGPAGSRKHSQSWAASRIKVHAAGCMGALMQLGASKKQAAIKVTRAVRKWPRHGSAPIMENTVANWRDEILQSRSTDERVQLYERLLKTFCEHPRSVQFLGEVMDKGPPLTGARRKTAT